MSTRLSAAIHEPFPPAAALLMLTPWSPHQADHAGRLAGALLHFDQDREIYCEGDEAGTFFKVVSGVARTCKFLSDGRRQIDAFHVTGDVFGVEAGPSYSLSAEAACDCTVTSYRRRGIDASAFHDAGLSRQLFAYAMQSLARAQDHALLLGRKSAVEKVAAFLLDWAKNSPSGQDVTLAITRQDVADYLGLTIETVSRTLSHLERQALIALSSPRQIRLRDLAALRGFNA
jgi:CRP/FNR family nitrogen fixation transcriptional regulator